MKGWLISSEGCFKGVSKLTYARREFTSWPTKFHCRSRTNRPPQCTTCTRRATNRRRRARCTPRVLEFQSRPSCRSQAKALHHTERWRIIRSRQNFQWRHYLKRNMPIRDLNSARAYNRNVTEHGEQSKVEGTHVSV